ncbi:MAG: PQQ-binding-like beta-propeller repeat protein [Aureispira sp.]|nr:PQQ-binding-like beta-propeller repeat protein [Aureispira sp.]
MKYLFGFVLSLFFITIFTTTTSAQNSLKLNSKVSDAMDKWYKNHTNGYTLKIHDLKQEADIESYYSKDLETADLIRVRYKGMLATLKFHKNIAKISTHADSLYKYFDYIAITDIYTGIEIDKWKISAENPINAYRKKDKITFKNNGLDRFSVVFDWEIYGVFGEKQTKECLDVRESHGCGRLPTEYVMDCLESKRQTIKFTLDVDITIQPLEAPEKKVYPNYLNMKNSFEVANNQSVLGVFASTQQAFVFEGNKQKNGGMYSLVDAAGQTIWTSTIKTKKKNNVTMYMPTAVHQAADGSIYVGVLVEETDTSKMINWGHPSDRFAELLKWDGKGNLKWVKVRKDKVEYNEYLKDIYVNEKGNIITAGIGVTAYSSAGKVIWEVPTSTISHDGYEDNDVEEYVIKPYGKNGEIVVTGSNSASTVLYRFDQKGKLLLERSYSDNTIDAGEAACVTKDGGVVIAGEAYGADGKKDNTRIWLFKTDKEGKKLWELYAGSSKVIRFSPVRVVNAVFEQKNGDILVVANNDEDDLDVEDFGDVDGYIFCVSKDGKLKWQQSLGTIEFDFIHTATYSNGILSIGINNKAIHYEVEE